MRRGFARAHGYREAGIAEARFVYGRPEESLYDAANYLAAPDPLSWRRARQDGFLLSHPFLDPEVIATMRRLPAEAAPRPGRPKAVLREAMADLLPERIRGRTAKIPFDQLYARGLRTHGDDLIDFCRCARHPLVTEMFDVETLCRAVREARLGLGDAYACDRVNSALALVVWLDGLGRATSRTTRPYRSPLLDVPQRQLVRTRRRPADPVPRHQLTALPADRTRASSSCRAMFSISSTPCAPKRQ
ncbi:asparagine synthase-related protein [Streptomyces nogalater]